ncbi:MAG: sulfotransferase family protein [Gammaproteobacteria bacterium]|nr:sulfotransferase family protein [Gammaproteobacteria bacterium]
MGLKRPQPAPPRQRARRVHVVGCRRSGTTLMMELLWYSYAFSGRGEHETSLLEPVPPGETLYLTKKPPDTTRIIPAFLRDSDTYLIAMLRDPRAVVASRHRNRPDVYFASFQRWRSYAAAIKRLTDHPRFAVIRFESLVSAPDAVQADIESWLPFLSRGRAFTEFPEGAAVPPLAEASLNGARPFDPSRLDGWRSHLPRIKGQLEAHPDLTESLIEFGYEADDAWTALLEGVAPYRQTYKETPPSPLRRWETNFRYRLKTRRYLRSRRK